MRIKETKVYKFNELSEEAKEYVIRELWMINVDHEWWNYTFKDAKNIGLQIDGFDIERGSYVEGGLIEDAKDVAKAILKEHGESTNTYQTARDFLDNMNREGTIFEKAESYDPDYQEYEESDEYDDLKIEFIQSLCDDYRIILSQEYDGLTGEEAIITSIEANEYEFTENGVMA